MKNLKTLLIILFASSFFTAYSQSSTKEQKMVDSGSWFKRSLEQSVYGIDLHGAQELLKNHKIKKTPIVAIIGSGSDIEHEALTGSVWSNPKESLNGKDSDKNGYIDDLNGWNFIGGQDGQVMSYTIKPVDLEWKRLKDKYANIIFDGEQFFIYEDGIKKQINAPSNKEEYNYFLSILNSKESELASTYSSYIAMYFVKDYIMKWDTLLLEKHPGKSRDQIDITDLEEIVYYKDAPKDSIRDLSFTLASTYVRVLQMFNKPKKEVLWDQVYENFTQKQVSFMKEAYNKKVNEVGIDSREEIVGDNPFELNDTKYGSNVLLTEYSANTTLFHGIIAGNEPGRGFSGVIPQAKIMTLVTSAPKGEPYIKDLALAIRYAVNNGADVIMFPFQSRLYSPTSQKWIYDAIEYAQKKGALVVVPVWERSEDFSTTQYFPSANMLPGSELTNFMTVACSDSLGNPSPNTNYGKEGLDIFAPGDAIYSTLPGDLYATTQASPSLGAAVTVGAAAFLKAYFPKLTGSQIRALLIENATDLSGTEVEINSLTTKGISKELFLFEQLCKSRGIINLKKATSAALGIK